MGRCMHAMMLSFGLLTLSGCGFQPMLAPIVNTHPIKVYVRGYEGYINHTLTKELEHRLAKLPLSAPIVLTVKISKALYDTSYGRDATALRTQHVLTAHFELTSKGALLKADTVDATTSYNLDQNDAFSTLSNRMGSEDQLIHALADEVTRAVNLAIHKEPEESVV